MEIQLIPENIPLNLSESTVKVTGFGNILIQLECFLEMFHFLICLNIELCFMW